MPPPALIEPDPAGRDLDVMELPALDQVRLRRAMGRFATGVTVVTTCGPSGKLEGVTANSFTTVSLDPPLVLWSLGRNSSSHRAFQQAEHFVVNILGVGQMALSRHFAKARPDKLAGVKFSLGIGDCPVLAGTIAHFECRRERVMAGGDHSIILGRVLHAAFRDGEPLVFAKGAYHRTLPLIDEVPS